MIHAISTSAQQYAWGKHGLDSQVAQLAQNISIDAKAPYAELWMGTHPKAPSALLASQKLLKDHLSLKTCGKPFDVYKDLPFLFKVLSVGTALSIQAHPDKKLAAHLFKTRPDIYKDGNHKPEMAIALTVFEALVGFRPLADIAMFLANIPALRTVVGEELSAQFIKVAADPVAAEQHGRRVLKGIFSALQKWTPVAESIDTILSQLAKLAGSSPLPIYSIANTVTTRLAVEYPGDIGILCVFLLNILTLQPTQAVYLGAGVPHAYLAGDCVECMATSDNVVRSGLTPKLRDVDTLLEMLTV